MREFESCSKEEAKAQHVTGNDHLTDVGRSDQEKYYLHLTSGLEVKFREARLRRL
jgi:hypothetical protein